MVALIRRTCALGRPRGATVASHRRGGRHTSGTGVVLAHHLLLVHHHGPAALRKLHGNLSLTQGGQAHPLRRREACRSCHHQRSDPGHCSRHHGRSHHEPRGRHCWRKALSALPVRWPTGRRNCRTRSLLLLMQQLCRARSRCSPCPGLAQRSAVKRHAHAAHEAPWLQNRRECLRWAVRP